MKVVVNGQKVVPSKKVKLWHHMKLTDVQKMIRKKKEELKNEQSFGN